MAGSTTPVEWVQGSRYWWTRFLTAPAFAALVVGEIWEGLHDPSWMVNGPGLACFWGVFLAILAVQSVLLFYSAPRRVGLSPAGLTVDLGLIPRTYPWHRVVQVTRTRVYRNPSNQIPTTCRTRVSLIDTWNDIRLTRAQGDRLASFLRIPWVSGPASFPI